MNKEIISDKQKLFLIFFILVQASIYVLGIESKQDFWLAIILSIFMSLIMAFIYARLHSNFLGKNLFDIVELCFDKFIGKIIILLYVWFTYEYVSQMLDFLGNFITTVSFPETPQIIPTICIVFLCIWIVKAGIEVIGRCADFFFLPICILIVIPIVLLIPEMDTNNLYPFFYGGIKPVLKGAFITFTYPFSEILICTMCFSFLKTEKSSYKIYILGLFLSGIILIATSLTIVLVLGVDIASMTYFPAYSAVAEMNIGNLLQRLEVVTAFIYLVTGFIKTSMLLLATCKGIAKIFGFEDYRFIVVPIALLALNLSYFEFDSMMYTEDFYFNIFPYYTIPFTIILPIIIFIVVEIRKKRVKTQLREI